MNFTIPLLAIGDQSNLGKRISVVIHKRIKNQNENEETKTLPNRKRSNVWDYFTVDPGNPAQCICRICQESVSYNNQGTSTTLIKHLQTVHNIVLETFKRNAQLSYGSAWKTPKTSDVWDYFDRHPDNPEKTICKICNKLISYKNFGTSSMKQHMIHHKIGKEDEDESPKKPDGRTVKKSDVWDHFDKDPDDPEKTICKVCNKSIAYKNSGTTAMKVHLKHHQKGGPTRGDYKPRQAKSKAEDSLIKREEDTDEDGYSGPEDDNNYSDGDLSPKAENFLLKMSPKHEVEDNESGNDDPDFGFMDDNLEGEPDFEEGPTQDEPTISSGFDLGKVEKDPKREDGFQNLKSEQAENNPVKMETKDEMTTPVKLNIRAIENDERKDTSKSKKNVTPGTSARHKSQVWEYFEKEPDNPERTKCKVCGKGGFNYRNHNTGSMMRHIKEHKEGAKITINNVESEEDKSKIFFKKLKGESRKGKSKIWEYYDRDPENKSLSICKICLERVKYPRWEPWYMEKHLLTEHEIRVRERERWSAKPVKKLNPETGKVEMPAVKNRADKKREVWNYFNFLDESNSAVQCKLCQEVVHNNSKILDSGKLGDQCVKHMNGHNIKLEEQTCSVCGQTFDEKTKFNKHMKHHFLTPETGFPCKYCGKLWAFKSEREKHERSHAGEKPFKV